MEADDDGSTAIIMHRWRWKKLRCGRSIYGMREGDEREKVFKIEVKDIFVTSLKLLGAPSNSTST